jgi:methylated-DNA-[protein]-cysteine S-methyltransferase
MTTENTPLTRVILQGRVTPTMTFQQKVWALCARIPRGRVTTYGHIARALGCNGARAVGGALNRNPYAPRVPCHRVVGSTGRLTGFAGGLAKKRRMLQAEGVRCERERASVSSYFEVKLDDVEIGNVKT